ncbi:MAG: hypothetical protein JNM43_04930 [Planctomycetaceae bacterium]|nr:hypothetical protein [Planctomycetaceae bacterium]
MKKEEARRWLRERLKTQERLTMGAMAAMFAIGGFAWMMELGMAWLIIRAGFFSSWIFSFLIAAGILGALQYVVLLRMPRSLADRKVSNDSGDEVDFVTAQPLSAVWMYGLGSLETDQSWQERLLGILCLPQRMISAGLFTKKRLEEVRKINVDACASVLRHLHKEAERVEVADLAEELDLADPRQTIRETTLIDGVVVLTRRTPGLSLANRLIDDINDWLQKAHAAND